MIDVQIKVENRDPLKCQSRSGNCLEKGKWSMRDCRDARDLARCRQWTEDMEGAC